MENEQRFNIPLDSPLDINSNDMLVNAASPKFAFNRQRFLGSVLQNSVRFEADGWFAGWWVHNFDMVTVGSYSITPDTLGPGTFQDAVVPGESYSDSAPRYWSLSFTDANLEFKFSTQPYVKVITGGPATVVRTSDQVVTVTGTTNKQTPVPFTATINAYTGALISFNSPDPNLVGSAVFAGGLFKLTVTRPMVLGNDFMYLRYAENINIESTSFTYSFDGTTHRWGTLLSITGNTVVVDPSQSVYTLNSQQLVDSGTLDERFLVQLKCIGTFTVINEVDTEFIGGLDSIYDAVPTSDSSKFLVDEMRQDADAVTAPDYVNEVAISKINFNPGGQTPVTWLSDGLAGYALPIWIKLQASCTFEFELEVYTRHEATTGYRPDTVWPYDPVPYTIPEWYECKPFVKISRKPTASTIQQVLDDFGVRWVFELAGQVFLDGQIPDDGSFIRVSLSNNAVISNRDLPAQYSSQMICYADNPDPLAPIPFGTVILGTTGTHNPKWPSYQTVPRPPANYFWLSLLTPWVPSGILASVSVPPQGWRNPVAYQVPWPMPRPDAWQNPVIWPAAWPATAPADWANPSAYTADVWPAAPADWQNPVAWNTLTWPATPPAGWDENIEAWPPVWPVGIDTEPAEWAASTATENYLTYIDALKPSNWPAAVTWPVTPEAGYQPIIGGAINPTPPQGWEDVPWPMAWPFGVTTAPGPNEWCSAGITYAQYLADNKPLDWPLRKDWPVVPQGGWNPLVAGVVNPTAPTTWATVPWPIDYWPFGIDTVPPDNNGFSTWYSSTTTYLQYLAVNKPTDWPITMTNMWPVTPEAGYVPATNWVINPDQPDAWIPPWPPNWAFGIAGLPNNEWYMNDGTTYFAYVQPYKPADWPIPWGWYPRMPGDNWPLWPEAGYATRTPAAWNGAVNANQPGNWTPPWPIQWPFGITTPPPAWYVTGTGMPDGESYIDYLKNHVPDRAYGTLTMTDPGWWWPDIGHPVKAIIQFNGVINYTPGGNPWPLTPDAGWQPYLSWDQATGQMVINPILPPNWPQYLIIEIEVPGSVSITTINTNLGPYVPILNSIALVQGRTDPKLVNYTSSQNPWWQVDMNCILPLCTRGWTFNRVFTTDITLCKGGQASPLSFASIEVGNTELGIRCFRLDTDAGRLYNGSNKYSLATVVAAIGGVTTNPAGGGSPIPAHGLWMPFKISLTFTNTKETEFDKVTRYAWPGSLDDLTGAFSQTGRNQDIIPSQYIKQYGYYPQWIVEAYGSRYWKTYKKLGQQEGFGINFLVNITYFMWLNDMASNSHSVMPVSPTNQALDARLTPQFARLTTASPGVFIQEARVNLSTSDGGTIDIHYSVIPQTATFTPNTAPWEHLSSTVAFKNPAIVFTHTLRRTSLIDLELKRAFIIGKAGMLNGISIVSATSTNIVLNTPYGNVKRDGAWENNAGAYLDVVRKEVTRTTVRIDATEANSAEIQYLPQGIWWSNKTVRYISITFGGGKTQLTFEYDGTTFVVEWADGMQSKLDYSVLDVRNGERKSLYRRSTTDIKMALKQHWSNDVRTENYWWIDKEHVLELTKYELLLHEKVKDPARDGKYMLHDWNADCWQVIARKARGMFFDTPDVYYSVSSTFNDKPVLFKLQATGTGINIKYIRDIVALNWNTFTESDWTVISIPVVGGRFSLLQPTPGVFTAIAPLTNAISAYMPVDNNALLLTGKVSATVINNKLLIGLAMTRGQQQWAVRIDMATNAFTVHNGYGHVGHNGSLTGGFYPALTVSDASGFKEPVNDIMSWQDNLNGAGVENKVYGSGSTLWFIYAELANWVSHFEYENDQWRAKVVPIATNYHMANERSGYGASVLADGLPRSLGLPDLFSAQGSDSSGASGALSYLSGFLLPSLWYMMPFVVTSVFSAQGRHNVAYVWRNKLPPKSDDGKSDKAVTVTRDRQRNSFSVNVARVNALVGFIMSIVGALGEAANDALTTNASSGQQSMDDTKGRKYGQMAANAVLDAVAASFTTTGLVLAASTETTELISTDMFYSIDDGCECWAGPGFVNHNMIGQAVAQGTSSTRWNVKKFGMYLPLEFIANLTVLGQYMVYKLLAKGIENLRAATDNMATDITVLGTGATIPIGMIVGAIMTGVQAGIDQVLIMYEWLIEKGLPTLYRIIGEQARGFNTGGVIRATTETEATHSYGNKPMSLFWPAFGAVPSTITVERVQSKIVWAPTNVEMGGFLIQVDLGSYASPNNNVDINNDFFLGTSGAFGFSFAGDVHFPKDVTACSARQASLPAGMSCVEGITSMLPATGELKNLQVNNAMYTFPAPPIHDYRIPTNLNLDVGVQAANGEIICYSADDIKLIDGPASNIVDTDGFFGIASSYIAIEMKDKYDPAYLRPWAVTPTCVGININGINCVQDARAYHGFDGQFNRIVSWKGGNGLDSATMVQQYAFIINNHFKRSNIIPPSEFFGLFNGPPAIRLRSINEQVANQVMDMTRQKGLDINIPGEDRDLTRYSLPIHSETLSTLPATVRMLAPYKLHVVEGITSLTTDVRSTQTKYKAPSSIDFNLYDTMYRATEEYIALLTLQDGVVAVEDKVPSAGLTFIGATTKEAFFYSPATRMYYSFSGGGDITKKDILNRFKDVLVGRWDFVNQEVMFKALLNDGILTSDVDGWLVARLDNNIVGEVYPPNETVYRLPDWNAQIKYGGDFKVYSMAGGTVYQGPKRCIVNRFVILDSMYDNIKSNKRRWTRVDRELWPKARDYKWHYDDFNTSATVGSVFGWTHNPFRLATAYLGTEEDTDHIFEWELTFCWTEQIEKLFEQQEFISFNVMGATFTQGGLIEARPSHIFLYKDLFRSGYYTMRYQSKNGMGNRERLYLWGDGISALESLVLFAKEGTKRRTQPLATSQVDVQELMEQ